jgi:hypothetical protein
MCDRDLAQKSVVMALQKRANSKGPVNARVVAEGYLIGAAGHLEQSLGARGAYAIVQRIADELAAHAINQKAKG